MRRSAVGLVAVLAAAACSDAAMTRAEFIAQAEAVCREANVAARALDAEPPILTPVQADWLLRLTWSDRAAVDRLEQLDRPPGDRATIETMLAELRAGLAYGERIARASRARDEQTFRAAVAAAQQQLVGAQTAAEAYGLPQCAQLGLVSTRG